MSSIWSRWRPALMRWTVVLVLGAACVAAWVYRGEVEDALDSIIQSRRRSGAVEHVDQIAATTATESLVLSPAARRNLGLIDDQIRPLQLQDYRQTLTIPAIVQERPGRTQIVVSTPLTGVVERLFVEEGQSVTPGEPLFQVRLTHEDLVQAQVEFLRSLGERDVETKEIRRLQSVTQEGAIPGRTLLERQYALEKLDALMAAQRESLRLHGLSIEQVEQISETRQLLRMLEVHAPGPDATDTSDDPAAPVAAGETPRKSAPELTVHALSVHKGQSVQAGEQLCTLADFSQLFVEGAAFEQDTASLFHAVENDWTVDVEFEGSPSREPVRGLLIEFLGHEIDPQRRAFPFYSSLPNEVIHERRDAGRRFLTWRYRPGQRGQVRLPIAEWGQQFVLPADAVAIDGPDAYVFLENGRRFDRIAVHVLHRDPQQVVVAQDGQLFAGDRIAWRGAHQLLLALKSQLGGGVDPHAGHNH